MTLLRVRIGVQLVLALALGVVATGLLLHGWAHDIPQDGIWGVFLALWATRCELRAKELRLAHELRFDEDEDDGK